MEKGSSDKEHNSVMEMTKKKDEEEEPQLPVSDSPHSIPFHSLGGSFAGSNHEVPHVAALAVEVANPIVHKVEHNYKVEEGIVNGENNSGFLMSKKEAKLIRALLWIRIIALVVCMLSFALMADDRNKVVYEYEGLLFVATNSFYNIKEFKFVLSVNVVSFIYCALQIWDLLNFMFTKQHLVNHKRIIRCFTFAMDQVLTYLLLSASVSAATVARTVVIDHGVAEFITKANASIAMSFLAFKAFALSTLISGYMLLNLN